MKTWAVSILLFALTIVSPPSGLAQRPAAQGQDEEKIVVRTSEVVLDAVVKDKKGRALKDLNASDFEVFEDGVPQEVRSFRLVTREAASANGPTGNDSSGAAATAKPSSQSRPTVLTGNVGRIGALALVFDRLSPNARSIARQAALTFLSGGVGPDDFVGVFGIDLSLRILQRFTNNEKLVRQAIERGLSHSSSSYASGTEQIATLSGQQAALQSQIDQSASAGGPGNDPSGSIGAAAAEQQMAAMTQNILEGFERLEHDQQGYATTDGLLAIISSMGRLPGRKALIFFSEGVATPTVVMTHFRSVISNANRANVSIYAVDAAGLRAESADAQAGRALTRLGQARARQAGSSADVFGSMMKDLERNEDLMNSNPDSALGDLANETGGLLISNTNEPGPRLRQVDADLHDYYLLTYRPKNQNYDGRFRQISLTVNRPGVEVQARKGYYALNTSYGSPIMAYEAPALAIMGGKTPPNAFSTSTGAFSFPESAKPGLVPVIVEIPAGSINFAIDNQKKVFHSDFAVVVLIKDESQRIVRKLSEQYLLKGPLNKLEGAKRGKILFYREAELEPGHYTIASVVYDALSRQSSVNTGSIVVPRADQTRLRLSSIVLIKSAERLPPAEQSQNPFRFGEVLLYPNLGEPVPKSANKDLTLFVTIYPPQGENSVPKLNLEIAQSGHPVGQFSYNLPAPDPQGRIQYASVIPLDKFMPGEYELRLTVQDGQKTASRSEHITITR